MAGDAKTGLSLLADQVRWAAENSGGSGMAGMAAMMGIPFQQKRGGQWMTIDPRLQAVYASGTTPPAPAARPQAPATGGPGPTPNDAEAKKRAEMAKAGLAPWWVSWNRDEGQYGGVSPQPRGLLDV
jgi:hypothetical protein